MEITHEDLRSLTDAIVDRGAPATAVHAREVVLQVYRWAIERGQKVENPADLVRPTTIAKFEPRDRALTPDEIGLMYQYMERIGTTPSIRAAAKLLLLTMVRKSELTKATWSEISSSEALWTIPKERMKRFNHRRVGAVSDGIDQVGRIVPGAADRFSDGVKAEFRQWCRAGHCHRVIGIAI